MQAEVHSWGWDLGKAEEKTSGKSREQRHSQSSELKERETFPEDLRNAADISANENIGSASPAGRGSVVCRLSTSLTHRVQLKCTFM